jgi:hypothetical protein
MERKIMMKTKNIVKVTFHNVSWKRFLEVAKMKSLYDDNNDFICIRYTGDATKSGKLKISLYDNIVESDGELLRSYKAKCQQFIKSVTNVIYFSQSTTDDKDNFQQNG